MESLFQALRQALAPLFAAAWAPAGNPLGGAISWAELLACAVAIAMVICNMRVHPAGWPLAMLSSALYALLFLDARLYGEAGLQLLFIVLAGWGWWQWLAGRNAEGDLLKVHRLSGRQRWQALGLTLAAWPALGYLLQRMTDSDVPFLDALPTVGSITGQFLLGRKLIENWPVWIAVNLVSIALFAAKALWLTVGLYALFAVLAGLGWRAWLRQIDQTLASPQAAAEPPHA